MNQRVKEFVPVLAHNAGMVNGIGTQVSMQEMTEEQYGLIQIMDYQKLLTKHTKMPLMLQLIIVIPRKLIQQRVTRDKSGVVLKYPGRKCEDCKKYPCFAGMNRCLCNFAEYGCIEYENNTSKTTRNK